MTVEFVSLFFYDISKTVCFISLQDFNDGRFCSIMRSRQCFFFITRVHWWSILFLHKISMTVGFVPLFLYEISMTVSFHCQSVKFSFVSFRDLNTVCFVLLRDFTDGRFCFFVLLRDFKDSRFCFITRFPWWSVDFVLLWYLKNDWFYSFDLLWYFKDSWFCFIMRFQW